MRLGPKRTWIEWETRARPRANVRDRLRQPRRRYDAPMHDAPHASGCDLIGSTWTPIPGDALRSHNPARPGETIWRGSPVVGHADDAVSAARRALPAWASLPIARRAEALRAFQSLAKARCDQLAALIQRETGKAAWDSLGEAKLLSDKVDITLETGVNTGRQRVTDFELSLSATRTGRTIFRPHGVMAVIGPFNFPAHLPNGHIVPALLMGNTVVFKPSDKAPAVGAFLASLFHDALESVDAPKGVFNMVQGGAETASRLVTHEGIDGILFTGSWPVGRRIMEANLDRPGRLLALEMGGNNAAVVMPDAHLKQAAVECVRSAFVTTGQRCTCTRRLIVHRAVADRFIGLVLNVSRGLRVGDPGGVGGQPVFTGPLIRAEAAEAVLGFQGSLVRAGATALLESGRLTSDTGGHFISPAVLRVDRFSLAADASRDAGCDVEVFGPLLRISIVDSLDAAIEQANASRYGLAASIFTTDAHAAARFIAEAKAGCVNVNTGTAGASSRLPFGGLDRSGNHRPAGALSLDYCAFPVAAMLERSDSGTIPPGMDWDDRWLV